MFIKKYFIVLWYRLKNTDENPDLPMNFKFLMTKKNSADQKSKTFSSSVCEYQKEVLGEDVGKEIH
jgi:hypothetical protein